VADRDTVIAWREAWRERAAALLTSLGLDVELDVANDPFFGRTGRMLASAQREQELKWEMLVPVAGAGRTAVASSNYHQDHFGHTYDIATAEGEVAHTGCMAFGEERVTLALLSAHGLNTGGWPDEVRAPLGLR
jgi:seryl-tRNA synthetase